MTLPDKYKKYLISNEDLENQLNEIFEGVDLDALHYDSCIQQETSFEVDSIIKGTVLSLRNDCAIINLNAKVEGVLPYIEEDSLGRIFNNDDLDLGDEINCMVAKVSAEGIHLSRKNVDLMLHQRKILETLAVNQHVVGKLIDRTPTGWVVDLNGLPALLAFDDEYLVIPEEGPESLLNTNVDVFIKGIDDMYVTLTREPFASQVKKLTKNNFIDSLKVGALVEGTVKNITGFGVFIQIASGVIGLCHDSDKGEEKLHVGKSIEARVLKIDRDKNRISLGIRQVTEPTWDDLVKNLDVDSKVEARVTSIMPYGAFLEVAPGLSGLLHVSDLSWSDHIKHPKELLRVGDQIEVVVLVIDREKQHITLGLKQVSQDPWELVEEKYIVGSSVEGRVTNKTKFGIFIELEPGVEGLAYHTVSSRTLRVDDMVQVSVMRIDVGQKKISLAFDDDE